MTQCWPARYVKGLGKRSRNVFAVGFSGLIATTVAARQPVSVVVVPVASVTAVTLLEPRVTVVVVAPHLPKTRLVVVKETYPSHPLGTFPEVAVWDDHSSRPAVLPWERFAIDVP